MAALPAHEERAVVAAAEDPGQEVVEVGRLHAVHVPVFAGDLEEVQVEPDPVDRVADLGEGVDPLRRVDELVAEAHAAEGVGLVRGQVVADQRHRVAAARLAGCAVVLEQAVQAAHHLVALGPLPGLGVPAGEFHAGGGVAEEVREGVVRAVPVRQHLGGVVEIPALPGLGVEHQQRLEDGHRGHAAHPQRARVAQPQPAPAEHFDPLVHLPAHGLENRPIARGLVGHQHAPDRVLAVPQIPAGVPAVGALRLPGVGDRDQLLVAVRAEVAVRILQLHHPEALLAHEREQRRIAQVVRHPRRREHQLAPELAAPQPPVAQDVVVARLERPPRLAEDLLLRELAEHPLAREGHQLRAGHGPYAHVAQPRRAHRIPGRLRHGRSGAQQHSPNQPASCVHGRLSSSVPAMPAAAPSPAAAAAWRPSGAQRSPFILNQRKYTPFWSSPSASVWRWR